MDKYYWNDQTEKSIQLYNNTTDDALRNKIYEEHIHIPLSKLVEVYVNKSAYKSTNKEQLQQELLGHFASQLDKVDPTKGKAFSYFSRSAQFFCWQNTSDIGRDENRLSSLDAMMTGDSEDGTGVQFEDKKENSFLTKETADQLDEWIESLDIEAVTKNIFTYFNKYGLNVNDKSWVREMGLQGIIDTYNNDEVGNARLNRCVSILAKIIKVECLPAEKVEEEVEPIVGVSDLSNAIKDYQPTKVKPVVKPIVKPVVKPTIQVSKQTSYTRNCPKCNDEIKYVRYNSWYRADSEKRTCVKCREGRPKTIQVLDHYTRNCPECNALLNYKTYISYYNCVKQNTRCYKCRSKKRRTFPDLGTTRNCPMCNSTIVYETPSQCKRALLNNSYCENCTRLKIIFNKMLKYLNIQTSLSICNSTPPVKTDDDKPKDWVVYFHGMVSYDTTLIKTYVGLLDKPVLSI